MIEIQNKTTKMLEVEKQFGISLEELIRTLHVDMKKSPTEIGYIFNTTRATVQDWISKTNITSRKLEGPSKTSKSIEIPFYSDESFTDMLLSLTDEQIEFGVESGFGGHAFRTIEIPIRILEKFPKIKELGARTLGTTIASHLAGLITGTQEQQMARASSVLGHGSDILDEINDIAENYTDRTYIFPHRFRLALGIKMRELISSIDYPSNTLKIVYNARMKMGQPNVDEETILQAKELLVSNGYIVDNWEEEEL